MRLKPISLQLVFASILLGLAFARLSPNQILIVLALTLSIIFLIRQCQFLGAILIILGFFAGQIRGNLIWQNLAEYDKYFDQKIELTGTVVDDAVYGFRRQVEFYVDKVRVQGENLPGRVKVSGFGVIEVKRGYLITAHGKLRPGFGSYQASLGFAEYQVAGVSLNPVEDFRHKFIAGTYSHLPEPQASLGLGFLAGFRSLLPDDLSSNLSSTGLTHIVAVSGYNTTIIAAAVHQLLAKRFSRFMVVGLTATVLLGFLAITGQSPSVVRACVVSGASLIAWYYGRRFKPGVLLLFAAGVTAWWSPIYLWYSVGWWLSFTAFFGVLILAPLILRRYFKNQPKLLPKIIVETTCAQVMTLPLIIWIFSKVSLVSILANLLVLPVIPLAMLATFVLGLSQFILPQISFILAWPARWILSYITDIVAWLAHIPGALSEICINKSQMLASYGFLGIITLVIFQRQRSTKAKLNTLY